MYDSGYLPIVLIKKIIATFWKSERLFFVIFIDNIVDKYQYNNYQYQCDIIH